MCIKLLGLALFSSPFCKCYVLVTQSCPTLCNSMDRSLPPSRWSSWPRNWTRVSALQADSLLCEPPGYSNVLKYTAAATAKSLQSCPTLCDHIDGSPPGSSVPGILLSTTLEWVAISFSNVWKWKVKVKSLSRVRLFATPWTAACQAPPSMGFSRQEYWSGLPLPSPRRPITKYRFQTYQLYRTLQLVYELLVNVPPLNLIIYTNFMNYLKEKLSNLK